jgi:predicted ATPase/class 3 adenylate cyclase/DNA-binding XRE family transcriptional regulator
MNGDQDATTFGDLLRRHRQAAGLTQGELAERAGLSVRGINDLERGARLHPRKDTVALLADALGLGDVERSAFAAAGRGSAKHGAGATDARGEPEVPELPTGTVTFLFTDIEGSTHLLQALGSDRYAVLTKEHHRLLRAVCAAHQGRVVDSQGDSCFMAFPTAQEALAAAAETQRALAAYAWPAGAAVRVRMGLHTGTAQVVGERYIGLDVHRAARIAAAGHGGQVLLSRSTRELVEDTLPDGASLRNLGAHRLKDLQRPEELAQLVLPDLLADFPSLNALDRHRHNLPIQLTSFVGREREVAELTPLLMETRLLTLTGPGGTGKTRLALRLAAEVVERFPDGVWLVELAPLADPALVPQTVATALGAREQPRRAPMDALLDVVRPKTLLLVLDNCEHLIAACAALAEALLRAAPGLRILASSREALSIAGETAYRVPSLPLPEAGHESDVAVLAGNDCVRLFVERAAAAQPAFHLTATNAPAIAQIGQRLDGIPLALELAAARATVLQPHQIAAGLDDRFRLLTGGRRTALPRHQTLHALIEWSHELLTEPERVLLRRLSVFAGGWSLDAAEAVCGKDLSADVLDTLARLADKSLVEVEALGEATEARYRLLETIRQYAREKLVAAREMEAIRGRHLDYFVRLAETSEPKLRTAEQLEWLGRLDAEHDNLRAALAWALERGANDLALRLVAAIAYFWILRYLSEGLNWLREPLARTQIETSTTGVRENPGSPPSVVQYRAKALHLSAMMYLVTLDALAARAAVAEALRLWRALGDTWWVAVDLEMQALIRTFQHEYEAALANLEEGVALARQLDDPWPLATCLIRFGDALRPMGRAAEARPRLEEGVALARRFGDRILLSEGQRELGLIAFAEGDLVTAVSLTEEALVNARDLGSLPHTFLALFQSISIACLQGNPQKARGFCREVLALDLATSLFGNAFLLSALGMVACFDDDPSMGVRLLAAGETLFLQVGFDINSGAEEPTFKVLRLALDTAQARLGPTTFQAAWAEGQQLPSDQAAALAMEAYREPVRDEHVR